jgi:hypothetical protein
MDTQGLPLPPDAFGWLAAGLTWLTFFCRDMWRLRCLALGANAAFIAYAAMVQLWPVLVLHLALMPVNLWRLTQVMQSVDARPRAASGAAGTDHAEGPLDGRGGTVARLRRRAPGFRSGSASGRRCAASTGASSGRARRRRGRRATRGR